MKLLPLLLAGLAPLAVSAAEEAVAVRVTTDKVVEIAIGDRPFAVYRPNVRGRLPKPFLLPVFAADGTVLTRPLENPEGSRSIRSTASISGPRKAASSHSRSPSSSRRHP